MAERTIFVEDVTVNEDPNEQGVFTVRRTGDLTTTDTVTWETVPGGSATEFEDYVGFFSTSVFEPGVSALSYSFSLIDDDLFEGLESFTIAVTDPGGNAPGLTVQDGTITIYDDENSDPDQIIAPTALETDFATPITFSLDDLLATATDPDGDPVSISGFDEGQFGSLIDNNDGTYTYTPGQFNSGEDLFFYLADGRGGSNTLVQSVKAAFPEIPIYNLEFAGANLPEGDSGVTNYVFTLERIFSTPDAPEHVVEESVRVRTDVGLLVPPEDGEAVATEGVDFEPIDIVLDFNENNKSFDIVVPVFGDREIEPNELFSLWLTYTDTPSDEIPGIFGAALPQDGVAVIVNDDIPEFTLELGTLETGNYGNRFEGTTDTSGDISATFEGTGQDLILSFEAFDVDLDTEVSVFLNGSLLSFLDAGVNDGFSSYSFDIAAEDQVAGQNIITFNQEINDTFIWGVTDILLDVVPPPTISVADVTVNEDDGGVALTFSRTGDASQSENFRVQFVSDTATQGEDFGPRFFEIFFPAGQDSFTFTVNNALLDDDFAEGLETFEVVLSAAPNNATPGTVYESGTVTIADNENSAPDFFEGPTLSTEFATPITFTLAQLLDGTTDPDGDPVSFNGFFESGQVNPDDITDNGDGTFTYSPGFFDPGGQLAYEIIDGRGGFNVGVININVDGPGTPIYNLEFGGMVQEGDSGTGNSAVFTLERIFPDGSGRSDQLVDYVQVETGTDLLVPPENGEGVATSGVDFVPVSEVLTFGPGGNSFDIVVPILGDTVIEPNELFDLDLFFTTGPNGEDSIFGFDPNLLPQDATATIVNDDQEGVPTDIDLTIGVTETGNFGNRFEGTTDTSGDIDASFTSTGTDLTLTFEAFDVDLDTEVSVFLNGSLLSFLDAGVNDGFSSYSFDIAAEDQVAGQNIITFNQEINDTFIWGVTDILLDVVPPPTISVADVTVNEDDGGVALTFSRTGDASQSENFRVQFVSDTATQGEDFGPRFFEIFFPAGQDSFTFTVNNALLDDDFAEGLETFEVVLSAAPNNATPGTVYESGTVTIADNENSDPDFFEGPTLSTEFATPITFTLAQLLDGTTDPDGDPVSFNGFFESGQVNPDDITDNGDGTFTYSPGFFDPGGQLAYEIIDGRGGFNVGVININVDGPGTPIYNLEFGGMVQEGDSGTGNSAVFTLERIFPDGSGRSDQLVDYVQVETGTDLLVPPENGEGVATSGVDFVPVSEVLTFGPGGNSFDIVVPILGDTVIEPNELFDLDLFFTTGPNGEDSIFGFDPNLLPQDATATIVNDDQEGVPTDIDLTIGVTETGNFGNRFEGTTDTSGDIDASFTSTGTDLTLTFEAFDVDLDTEVSVFLNGSLLSFLDAGVNDGFSSYSFDIAAEDQVAGQNIITFNQEINDTFIWGVTDILLEEDTSGFTTITVEDSTALEQFSGNIGLTFTREGDLSQQQTFLFQSQFGTATAEDFDAFTGQVTFGVGQSSAGVNLNGRLIDDTLTEGTESFTVAITNAPPGVTTVDGTISILDNENSAPDFFEGPTLSTEFATPITFTLAQLLDGTTDPDGDPVSFNGFFESGQVNPDDITDNGDGTFTYSPGFFDPGGQLAYEIIDGRGGFNVGVININVDGPGTPIYNLEFGGMVQEGDSGTGNSAVFTLERIFPDGSGRSDQLVDYVQVETGTDLLVPPENGEGVATSGVDFVPVSEVLTFGPGGNSFDIVVPILGDTVIEPNELFDLDLFFTTGPNGEDSIFGFDPNLLPQDATATIVNDDQEGVPTDIDLTIGVTETGNFGNRFEGTTDTSGDIDASFTSTGTDLTLTFEAFDVDLDTEVSVFLNGSLLSFLDAGVNDGFSSYSFDIAAEDQVAGQNIITFNQEINDTFIWGVTDILLEEDVPPLAENELVLGVENTGSFGNRFDGQTDDDGLIDFFFESGGSDDLVFTFKGFDIDLDTEVELFLNGASQGFLDAGINDGLEDYSVVLAAADQVAGENTITFEQALNDTFIWGVTDLLIVV